MVDYRHYDFPNVLAGELRPVPVASAGVGTWIVIILVVLAVCGLIVAIGIPMYQGYVLQSKWSEAKANCGMINAALQVIKAENSGSFPDEIQSGSLPELADTLDLYAEEFESPNFSPGDYQIVITDSEYGEFYVEVTSSKMDGPPGTYRLYWNGMVEER